VRFRLLGEVGVLNGDEPMDIGHARQRCVLAALLVDANRTVSVDTLIDRVWGSQPPQRARESLYSYLSRLRQVLAGVGGGTDRVDIVRRSGGYQLTVNPATIDLHRFRQLVAEARRSPDEQAAALFEQASGLWQGTAFADLDTPWVNAVRHRLDDERLAAELDANEVLLRRGRHADLLADLSARATAYPLDERIARQLMLTLYRSGRQAEALDRYQLLRHKLAEDLGTDPGAQLRQLHQRILTADPTLALPVEPPVGPPAVIPRQLPAPPALFTGRVDELAALGELLRAPASDGRMAIAVISGVGGLGKSRLALQWAHGHSDRFPDGQLYVDLRGFDPASEPMPATVALRGFLDALGVPATAVPVEPAAQTALYRSRIAGRRVLVVLDNARDTEHVIPLLPGSPSCTVLVTSRHQLTGLVTSHGARLVAPDMLDPAEARQLLVDTLGAARTAPESDAVDELVVHCAGLPLALAILAARAAAHPEFPLAMLVDELRDAGSRLDALDGGEVTANLSAVFACSYRALEPGAARFFALLGLANGPDIGVPAAAALADLPVVEARVLLRQLETVHLVRQHAPGRYRMHDLIRLYADRQARSALSGADRVRAVRGLIEHYLHTAAEGDRVLAPHRAPVRLVPPSDACRPVDLPDQAAATAWFEAEHACVVAAQELAAAQHLLAQAWQLAWVTSTFHGWRGMLYDDLAMWRVGHAAAQRLGDPATLALACRFLGRALGRTGRHTEALPYLRQAVTLLTDGGDRFGAAHTHRSLAWISAQQGDHDTALEHAAEALRLYREVDEQAWVADALDLIGWHEAQLGRYGPATEHSEQALALHREHGNQEGEANALETLGYVAHHTAHPADALGHYREALAVYRKLGDAMQEAGTLEHLGDVHASTGAPTEARVAWQGALRLFTEQHRTTDVARTEAKLTNLETGTRTDK
jgi:DNA-binding SARP family transcriptional activator/tetratricopeptide (TPR) repeat protein